MLEPLGSPQIPMTLGASCFTMRSATANDLAALTAVDARCFRPGIAYSPREIASMLRAPETLTLIAENSRVIAGFAAARLLLSRLPRRRLYGELITIDVLPEFRRAHVGWRLYHALEDWLLEQNASRIELHVAIDNDPAIRFYQRLGYVFITRVPGYYPEKLDAWKMEKPLAEGSQSAAGRPRET